jgi:hypothetical protein
VHCVVVDALPALFLMDVQSMSQYPYKGMFTWSALSEFTSKVLNGELGEMLTHMYVTSCCFYDSHYKFALLSYNFFDLFL